MINPLERINSKGNVNDILTLNGMDQKKLTVKNLIDLLTSRTYKQRMQLSATYQNKTQNTQNSLPSLLQNSFGPLFNGLFMDMKALLGIYVQNSLDRAKDWAYMSILCTSSASQLQMLKDYQFTYKPNPVDSKTWKQVTLDEFIHKAMNHYSGKKVLSTIINADPLRPDSGVDQSKFKKQLKAIPNLGTDCVPLNNHLLDLMAKESFDHIKAVDDEYRSKHDGKTILGQIDQHCSGDMKEAYRRIGRGEGIKTEDVRGGKENKEKGQGRVEDEEETRLEKDSKRGLDKKIGVMLKAGINILGKFGEKGRVGSVKETENERQEEGEGKESKLRCSLLKRDLAKEILIKGSAKLTLMKGKGLRADNDGRRRRSSKRKIRKEEEEGKRREKQMKVEETYFDFIATTAE
ncbi:hypothetical protein LSTR_LSTR011087 [Laodelphax striatellus]|uniref:Uncharacterized protein n=1 Tax=Laodelphax striatellus TaxID=195883 RepID=A0A482WV38_LAOST|nr:hypothetical protein LSTR_LSTR011087 [Laodelphax striatellus]